MTRYKLIIYTAICGASILWVFFPSQAFAKTTGSAECSPVGYTVAFINGIFDSRDQAQANATALQLALDSLYKGEPINVQLAYNAEHLGGGGDLAETISQMLFSPISDYDLQDLLRQLSTIDTTQKLLMVGFSQGALYGNSIYEYLVANGEPASSLGLYAVATPSNYVAGGGSYLNSNEDAVIFIARAVAEKVHAPLPLPGNVDITGSLAVPDLPKTHAFVSYLTGAHERVESDIYRELGRLQEWKSVPPKKNGCISSPKESLADFIQQALFSVADPAAAQFKTTVVSAYQNIIAAVVNTLAVVQAGYAAISSVLGIFGGQVAAATSSPVASETQEKDFGIVKRLYGSSLDRETYEELNPEQGAAVPLVPQDQDTESVVTTTSIVGTPTSGMDNLPVLAYSGGTGLPSPSENEFPENTPANETVATTTDTENSSASSTPPASTATGSTATSTTTSPPVATTSPEMPPPFKPEPGLISDTFNAFNRRGWQTFGENVKNFDFDDGTDGECLRNGCVAGMGGNVYDTLVPRMYIQAGLGTGSGAYTLYVKARAGFTSPAPAISICYAGYASCTHNGSTYGISFLNMIPLDGKWHHYYVAWKQGDPFVQSCFMQDYRHFSDCVWVDTEFPAGTKFDGIALWSTRGWRADVAPNANLWFDELEAK